MMIIHSLTDLFTSNFRIASETGIALTLGTVVDHVAASVVATAVTLSTRVFALKLNTSQVQRTIRINLTFRPFNENMTYENIDRHNLN